MADLRPVMFTVPGEPVGKWRVSIELLREFLDYDPITGILRWKKQRGTRGKMGSIAGSKCGNGYVIVGLAGVRSVPAHRIAFALMTGTWPELQVDHIDGDRANNAWSNLRLVTAEQNHQNLRRARADNGTGILGVSFKTAATGRRSRCAERNTGSVSSITRRTHRPPTSRPSASCMSSGRCDDHKVFS